jgi:hypothetical protein
MLCIKTNQFVRSLIDSPAGRSSVAAINCRPWTGVPTDQSYIHSFPLMPNDSLKRTRGSQALTSTACRPRSLSIDLGISWQKVLQPPFLTSSYTSMQKEHSYACRAKTESFSLIERVILSAGAMLIFSVSFQIDQMPEGGRIRRRCNI